MPSLYKKYVSILTERLKEEIENRRLLSETQFSFRKGRGTMDAVYILNYLINRQVTRKKGTLVALFVDLKAAFDSVGRETVLRASKERKVREGLVVRIGEVLAETKK